MAHSKPFLPARTCAVCGRRFVWRKRWRKEWDQVRYYSQRFRQARRGAR